MYTGNTKEKMAFKKTINLTKIILAKSKVPLCRTSLHYAKPIVRIKSCS